MHKRNTCINVIFLAIISTTWGLAHGALNKFRGAGATATGGKARHCANGWTMLNGKCARRFGFAYKERKSWEAAEEDCVSKGGHLASVADANQLKALASFCFRGLQTNWKIDCAVGLRRGKGGAFVWTDGLRFNSELAKEPHMSGHRKDHMHIEGHYFDMLEGDSNGGRGPFVYVCGMASSTTTSSNTTAKASCTTIVKNGGFEDGWVQPWKQVGANTAGLPGWTVTQGSIDFGNYNTGGHCDRKPCAHGGQALLDICGSTRGAIAQTVTTVPNTVYVLTLAYDAHAGCTWKNTMVAMDVLVNGKRVKRLRHKNEYTWDLDWADFRFEFEASGASVTLEFKSVNSACGCMLLDDVTLRPKQCIATTTAITTTTTPTRTTSHDTFTDGWVKSKGACRYSDGSFDAIASTQVTNHDECKDFCNTKSKCDAFDTDGSECFLFQHKNGKKHTGDGIHHDFCYIRVSWVKTKGACRYSDGSFDTFASTQVTNHDACKDFCNTNSKCDAFDTDGSECLLFQHKDGKKHTGNGHGHNFCYVRTGTVIAAAPKNDSNGIAALKSAEHGVFVSSLSAAIVVIVVIVGAAAVVVIVVLVKKKQSAFRGERSLGNDALPAFPLGQNVLHALPLDVADTNIEIMVKGKSESNDVDGLQFV